MIVPWKRSLLKFLVSDGWHCNLPLLSCLLFFALFHDFLHYGRYWKTPLYSSDKKMLFSNHVKSFESSLASRRSCIYNVDRAGFGWNWNDLFGQLRCVHFPGNISHDLLGRIYPKDDLTCNIIHMSSLDGSHHANALITSSLLCHYYAVTCLPNRERTLNICYCQHYKKDLILPSWLLHLLLCWT